MPAWLTPRIRLGATASLIVLIAVGLLVTPQLFHDDDADAPVSLTSVNSSVESATRSLRHRVAGRRLCCLTSVLDKPDSTPRPPSPRQLSPTGGASASTQADPPTSEQESPTAQDSAHDSFGPSYSLASDGSAGADGSTGPGQFAANGLVVPPSGGASGGPRGAARNSSSRCLLAMAPAVAVHPVLLCRPGDRTCQRDSNRSRCHPMVQAAVMMRGHRKARHPSIRRSEPPDPPMVQVPEPTSFVMAGMGALSFMIRARLARKRRG